MTRPHPLGDYAFGTDEAEDSEEVARLPEPLGTLDVDQFSEEALEKLSETELLRLAEVLQGDIHQRTVERAGILASHESDLPADRSAIGEGEAEPQISPQSEAQAATAASVEGRSDQGAAHILSDQGAAHTHSARAAVDEPRKTGASGRTQVIAVIAALACIAALLAFVVWSGRDPCEKRIAERCGHLQSDGDSSALGLDALRRQLQESAEARGGLEREAEELRIQEDQLRRDSERLREDLDGLVLQLGDPKAKWNTGRILDGGRFVVQLQDVAKQPLLDTAPITTTPVPPGALAAAPLPTPAPLPVQSSPSMPVMPGMMPGIAPGMMPPMMPEPPADERSGSCPSDEVLTKMRAQMDEASDENDRLRDDPELAKLQSKFMRQSQLIHTLLERHDGLAKEILTAKSRSPRCEAEAGAPYPKSPTQAELAQLRDEAARLEAMLQSSMSQ